MAGIREKIATPNETALGTYAPMLNSTPAIAVLKMIEKLWDEFTIPRTAPR
jgi:hypothetical protein